MIINIIKKIIDKIMNNQENQITKKKSLKKPSKHTPSQIQLNQVWEFCLNRKNRKGETNRYIHECLFLLCWKAGLRITEAATFDLSFAYPEEANKNYYKIKGKRDKERAIYVSPAVLKELKKRDWKPADTPAKAHSLRVSFLKYLAFAHKELNLPSNIELSPHTLRKCFATNNITSGMPLNMMQQYLGHEKITTTAIYIKKAGINVLSEYKPID